MSRFLALLFGCSLLLVVANAASAQDDINLRIYGRGVHAYHAGQYEEALKNFNTASDAGLRDPRCFYFRGLALLKLGKAKQAEADFKSGAALEATNPSLLPIVSAALQRVQGHVRVDIESHRVDARFKAVEARKSQKQALYGNRQADKSDPISGLQPPPSGDDAQLFGDDAPDQLVEAPADSGEDDGDLFNDESSFDENVASDVATNRVDDNPDDQPDDGDDLFDKSPSAGEGESDVKSGRLRGVFGRILGAVIPGGDEATPMVDDPFVDDEPESDGDLFEEEATEDTDDDDLFGEEATEDTDDGDLFGDEATDDAAKDGDTDDDSLFDDE